MELRLLHIYDYNSPLIEQLGFTFHLRAACLRWLDLPLRHMFSIAISASVPRQHHLGFVRCSHRI